MHFRILGLILFVFTLSSSSPLKVCGQGEKIRLENGITIFVNSIPEAEYVGAEAFYRVGFLDEPKSMVQSSHLIEHLVCYGPGAGFETGQAMDWLNAVGMGNAETLPTLTHYDYAVPSQELEKIFEIEASRLQQSSFSPDLIRREAKRVYEETDYVEQNPRSGMFKHAFMALSHCWRYNSKSALVRGGLEDLDPEKLLKFYRKTYVPRNLFLVFTGNVSPQQVQDFANKHLSKIPSLEPPRSPINWTQVKPRNEIRWDSKYSAVCIAWSPPKDPKDRLLLNILASTVTQKAMMQNPVQNECHAIFVSNPIWSVGDLPLFIYALAKPGESLEQIETKLERFMVAEMNQSLAQSKMAARMIAGNFEFQLQPQSWTRVQQTAQALAQRGMEKTRSFQQILAQDALTKGMAYQFLNEDPQRAFEQLKLAKPTDFERALKNCMTNQNKKVVYILPSEK
ncbi:MAG: insulinase family protein [Planctomycetota bacterium]